MRFDGSDGATEGELVTAGRVALHGRDLQVVSIAKDVVAGQAHAAQIAHALLVSSRCAVASGSAIWDVAILFALLVALARFGYTSK